MDLRQLAEVLLTAREASRRMGSSFRLHDDRLRAMGINPDDLPRVLNAVTAIEDFRESQLAALK